jgi:hypothetical protein
MPHAVTFDNGRERQRLPNDVSDAFLVLVTVHAKQPGLRGLLCVYQLAYALASWSWSSFALSVECLHPHAHE